MATDIVLALVLAYVANRHRQRKERFKSAVRTYVEIQLRLMVIAGAFANHKPQLLSSTFRNSSRILTFTCGPYRCWYMESNEHGMLEQATVRDEYDSLYLRYDRYKLSYVEVNGVRIVPRGWYDDLETHTEKIMAAVHHLRYANNH